MFLTGDPIADFNSWDREQDRRLESKPTCAKCKGHIQQKDAIYIDGRYYCDDCLECMREGIGDD